MFRVAALGLGLLAALAAPALALGVGHLTVPEFVPPLDPALPVSGWAQAARVQMSWNVPASRPASEPSQAAIATDGTSLYVRFDATQHEPVNALQHTDNVGQGNDDAVWVDLWPDGTNGYSYQFQATPNGTHYQSSSENTTYTPTWQSFGSMNNGGYTVTMKIPLNVMRGIAAGVNWRAQFVRYIHATGEIEVWSYDPAQTNADDVTRAGILVMPPLHVSAPRPKPRLATYALGEAASKTIGGSTSRVGADLSIPITPTAAFYATFHPDYSNVELDQQSIAPTVFARYYSEVRPFFTQGANFYNQFNCDACPSIQELYTPAIPTPRDGYAVEGRQGPFSFATFDALGDDGRNDIASAIDYSSADGRWGATVQRVSVDYPDFVDDVTTTGITYYDLKHISAYFNYGSDSGTNVLVPDQAQRYDFGGGWANSTFGFFGSVRKLGEYYDPADGFVSHPGIAGYALYSAKIWTFAPNDKLAAVGVAGFLDRYQGPQQGIAQSDNSLLLDVLTKSAWDFQLFTGSNYWRFNDPLTGTGILTPVSQNGGFQITYHSGLQTNNPGNFPYHGSSSDPTSINFSSGAYGNGRLDTWFRSSTLRVGSRGALTLALDDTAQWFPHATPNIQWFENASFSFQITRNSSFAVGVRRVIGDPPQPNGGGDCIGTCSNITVAYHLLTPHTEYYVAYGNPNALTTVPQAIFKVIFYAGAEKGT
ncbi:MAG TPA: hypothetical protein VGK84_12070 [Candidatus Tumulicola sp.]|jgi:hypothetical protein